MKKNSVYKCTVCGMVMEVLHGCDCSNAVLCCGKEMLLMEEQTADSAKEKHVPYPAPDTKSGLLKVSVGQSEAHPMTGAHHIEWVEVRCGDLLCRRSLLPGGESAAHFPLKPTRGMIVREYCNIHGLWSCEIK